MFLWVVYGALASMFNLVRETAEFLFWWFLVSVFIYHPFILGAFDDPDIIHVDDLVDPVRDLETISAELRLKVKFKFVCEFAVLVICWWAVLDICFFYIQKNFALNIFGLYVISILK